MASDKVEERGQMRLMHLEIVGQAGRHRRGQQLLPVAGFTLIEVVIVMAVVAILTAIAIPNYFQFIARGHRSEARATLTAAAQWMERFRTERGTYNGAALPANAGAIPCNRYADVCHCGRACGQHLYADSHCARSDGGRPLR